MTVTTRKLQASFWQYDGNHYNGKNCERKDPHGFGLDLIAYLAYQAQHEYSLNGLSLDSVEVKHHKGDSFGHEVTVKAPKNVWDAAKSALEAEEYV